MLAPLPVPWARGELEEQGRAHKQTKLSLCVTSRWAQRGRQQARGCKKTQPAPAQPHPVSPVSPLATPLNSRYCSRAAGWVS